MRINARAICLASCVRLHNLAVFWGSMQYVRYDNVVSLALIGKQLLMSLSGLMGWRGIHRGCPLCGLGLY